MISIYLFQYLPFRNLSRGKSLGGKRRFSPPGKLQDEGMDSVCKSIFKGKSNETSSGGSGSSTSSNGTTGSTLEEMGISLEDLPEKLRSLEEKYIVNILNEIIYNGKQGYYICSEYVSVKKIQENELYYTTSNFGTRINENYANVRKTPNGTIIDRIYLGTEVKILSSSNGSSQVSYYNGKEGYVYTRLIYD